MAPAVPPPASDEPAPSHGREHAKEILVLGLIAAVALAAPPLIDRAGSSPSPWARLLVPSIWLLGAGSVWLRRRPIAFTLVCGGRRAWGPAVLCVLLALAVLAVSGSWPVRPEHTTAPLAQSLCLVLLVPAAEELFFRGLLLDHLQRTMGWPVALLGVSALFGLLHWPQGTFWPMVVLSVLLCAVTWLTASLLWAPVLHAGWNAASLLIREPSASHRLTLAVVAASALLAAAWWGLHTRSPSEGRS